MQFCEDNTRSASLMVKGSQYYTTLGLLKRPNVVWLLYNQLRTDFLLFLELVEP